MKALKRALLSFFSMLFLVAAFYYSGPTTVAPSYDLSLPRVNTPFDAINDSLLHFDTNLKAEPCAISAVDWYDSIGETE